MLSEPSVVALDKESGRLLRSELTHRRCSKDTGNIVAIRPQEGVISDYDMTERMIKEFYVRFPGSDFQNQE